MQVFKNKLFISLAKVLFIAYVLFMLWELFLGQYRSHGIVSYNFIPFRTIKSYILNFDHYSLKIVLVNLLGNIVVFIPMGIFMTMFIKHRTSITIIAFASSVIILIIELMQIALRVGSFDVDDIILNVFGSITGFLFYKLVINREMLKVNEKERTRI